MSLTKDVDFIERFMTELILFRNTARKKHLTEQQWQVIKLKLYETIFDFEAPAAPIEEISRAKKELSG